MRKLRLTEAEDLVTGKEYVKRLRRQYERLQPTPEWASYPTRRAAKRRKTGGKDTDRSDDGSGASADEMDTDTEEDMSQQPLARLLQNVGSLSTRDEQTKSKSKRKLRQEVLDIQRLKDVGGNQPVSNESSRMCKVITNHCHDNLVHNRLINFPSPLSPDSLIRPCLDPLPPPRLPAIHLPKPPHHISPRPTHTPSHQRIPPTPWKPHLLRRPPSLLPRLGSRHRQNCQSQRHSGPQRRAKIHGAVQTLTVRSMDGSDRKYQEGRRYYHHP